MVKIIVNGVQREVQAPDDTPLLYVLRNDLQLSGPQFGCGLAQCGACSVLIDGKEVRSCVTPLSTVANQEITTLEGLPARWAKQKGLSRGGSAEHASPCPASMDRRANTSVRILPERNDDRRHRTPRAAIQLRPTAQIKAAFTTSGPSAHLCRCGSYTAIIDAVKRAASLMAKGR